MVRPSQRREMASRAVAEKGASIALACAAFGISESCYRYRQKMQSENTQIADWLVRITDNNRNWGFGLSFLYLRNVKGYTQRILSRSDVYRKCDCSFSGTLKLSRRTLLVTETCRA